MTTDPATPPTDPSDPGTDQSDPAEPAGPGGGAAARKDPSEWATGDEPATAPQLSYLETLAHDTGAEIPAELTKAQASQLIDQLRGQSPRVADSST